jgi:hypothetical protein
MTVKARECSRTDIVTVKRERDGMTFIHLIFRPVDDYSGGCVSTSPTSSVVGAWTLNFCAQSASVLPRPFFCQHKKRSCVVVCPWTHVNSRILLILR